MNNCESELAEYRLFDTLDNFVANKPTKAGPLKVKGDRVIVPSFGKNYITYIRAKRLCAYDTIKDDGSIMIFHDSSAYSEISAEFFQLVMFRKRGIYLKEQSMDFYQDTSRFIVSYHFPHWLSYPHLKYDFNTNRPIDVMYAGKQRRQRNGLYEDITRASKKLKLNSFFAQSKKQIDRKTGEPPAGMLKPKDYVKKLRTAKIAYSLLGTGYRSHRDWEALLCGAFLINDHRSVQCCQFRGLEEFRHFVSVDPDHVEAQLKYWIKHEKERNEIARAGFEAAWEIWRDCADTWQPARILVRRKIEENGWI